MATLIDRLLGRRRPDPRPRRRTALDNRLFWNNRYSSKPELGSGIGSRGDLAQRKRELVEQTWRAYGQGSVLDVGFGDLEVLDLGVFTTYVGVDIADVAVERGREAFPHHTFVRADFGDAAEPELPITGADLVLCFDVLIHQFDPDSYRRIIERLVRFTRRVGLVAAYDTPPAKGSPIVAYHEPVSTTLERAGAKNLEPVMSYRGLRVLRYEPPAS
jgi:hypothetical protein